MHTPHRKLPIRAVFPRRTAQKEDPAAPDLSSCLSYALLILYILASVSATKDSMLLLPSKGIQLPLVTVMVSIVGFYALSPVLVLIGHLITLRRLPKLYASLNAGSTKTPHDALNRNTDKLLLGCLLIAGPATLLLILTTFAAYQSPPLFLLQVACLFWASQASRVRYRELLAAHVGQQVQRALVWARRLGTLSLMAWLITCIDVIFVPPKYSVVLWAKTHTTFLSKRGGGTVAWIPHIEIDRSDTLWPGPTTRDLAVYPGHADTKEYFMARELGMDLRERHLRYLDISMQVIPRIWAHGADLTGANLTLTRLYGSMFVGTHLNGVGFEGAELDGSTFELLELDDMSFRGTSLKGTMWDNVTMKHVWFNDSDLSLASFIGVKLSHVGFNMTSLQATSYFDIDSRMVEVLAQRPYQIFVVPESDVWP